MKNLTILILFVLLSTEISISRSSRVNQIPNGTVKNCMNCHLKAAGGGTRNIFGTKIETDFLNNGNVVWNAELAAMDSDGDGFTNGAELQDPLGTWKIGNPAPGNPALATNPGDANSVPSTTRAEELAINSGFRFNSISPNPVNENFNISFSVSTHGVLEIELYNSNGKFVKNLYNGTVRSGEQSIQLNINGSLNSGNYFLNIRYNGYSWIENLNVIR